MKKLLFVLTVWVLFRSGLMVNYKDAADYKWVDGSIVSYQRTIVIPNMYLVLVDSNHKELKCFNVADIRDVSLLDNKHGGGL